MSKIDSEFIDGTTYPQLYFVISSEEPVLKVEITGTAQANTCGVTGGFSANLSLAYEIIFNKSSHLNKTFRTYG